MIKKTIKLIEWLLFLAILSLALMPLIPSFSEKAGIYIYTVTSGSMEPTIPTGSLVIATLAPVYRQGDIISFTAPDDPNKTIIHRINQANTEDGPVTYQTKGDNNSSADIWTLQRTNILAKANIYIPHLGNIILQAKTPRGFLLYIGLPALLCIVLYLRTVLHGIKEYADKQAHRAVEQYKQHLKKHGVNPLVFAFFALYAASFIASVDAQSRFNDSVTLKNLAFATASKEECDRMILIQKGASSSIKVTSTTSGTSITVNSKTTTTQTTTFFSTSGSSR